MNKHRDAPGEAGNENDPIDHDRILRSIERIRMLPPILLILATIIAVAAMIYWL